MGRSKTTARARANMPERFVDLPNIGPAMAADFVLLGMKRPADLVGRDPHELFARLCKITRSKQDPCVLDTFMAVVDYVGGAPERPWWKYTAERKRILAERG